FQGRGQLYLAQEMIQGISLRNYMESDTYLLSTNRTAHRTAANGERLTRLWASIAQALATVHERGIAFGDAAPGNIIITDSDRMNVRLIDFGGAVEADGGIQRLFSTRGYSGPDQIGSPSDDLYGLGALMLASMWPLNNLVPLKLEGSR